MRETKRCYKLYPDERIAPEIFFEIKDGPNILQNLKEDLMEGTGPIEIELTIRYLDKVKE